MTDDDRNMLIGQEGPDLPAPRFDESASANAQPVQPISVSRFAAWRHHAGSMWRAVATRSRTLVLVVIAGLATGTLGGMAWVQHRQETRESPAMNESVSEVPAAGTQGTQEVEPRAPMIVGSDLQSTGSTSAGATTRIRKTRTRVRSGRATRAYRVGVIR